MSFMQQLNTKEKCTLRDLIKEEIKSLDKAEDEYGQYRYDEYEYCAFLLKLGRKLKLDIQQKIKAKKVYRQKGNMEKISKYEMTEQEQEEYQEYEKEMQYQLLEDVKEIQQESQA